MPYEPCGRGWRLGGAEAKAGGESYMGTLASCEALGIQRPGGDHVISCRH